MAASATTRLFLNAIRYLADWHCLGRPPHLLRKVQQHLATLQPLVRAGRLDQDRCRVAGRRYQALIARASARRLQPPVRKTDGSGGRAASPGRSRGGFGTVHGVVNPLGHPVALKVTGSEAADSRLPGLIAGLQTDLRCWPTRATDSDANRSAIRDQVRNRVIPPRRNRKESGALRPPSVSGTKCGRTDFFGQIKQYRRVATASTSSQLPRLRLARLNQHHARLTSQNCQASVNTA